MACSVSLMNFGTLMKITIRTPSRLNGRTIRTGGNGEELDGPCDYLGGFSCLRYAGSGSLCIRFVSLDLLLFPFSLFLTTLNFQTCRFFVLKKKASEIYYMILVIFRPGR